MCAVPSPDESCARQSRSRAGTRPKVSVSIATSGPRSSPSGKSPLCSLIFNTTALPESPSEKPPVHDQRRYGQNLGCKQGETEADSISEASDREHRDRKKEISSEGPNGRHCRALMIGESLL